MTGPPTPPPDEQQQQQKPKRRGGPLAKENRRLVAGLVIGAIAAAFAVVNRDDVEVDWLVTTSQTPLIVVIAIAFFLGALLGWLVSAVGRRRR